MAGGSLCGGESRSHTFVAWLDMAVKDEGILDWGGGQTLVIGRVVAIIVDQLRKRRRPRVPQSVNAARGLGGGGTSL